MSLFAEYVKELDNQDVLENEYGFVWFKIEGPEAYIKDIYVKPQYRKQYIASQMADEVAKIALSKGCKYLTGSVSLSGNQPNRSIQTLIHYGFKVHSYRNNLLWFIKEL